MILNILYMVCAALLLLVPVAGMADADDGAALARQQCGSCHELDVPEAAGLTARLERTAPPLYYAGNKYREAWLQKWLQQPERLHPAGYFPHLAMKNAGEGDVPDLSVLEDHPVVTADEAADLTAYLMSLRSRDALLEADAYEPGSVALRMAQMDFRKFKGCDACHQDAEGEGGYSGPQLYSAWQRLQPSYISSYIQNPTAWDPQTIMPVSQMNEAAVHKLANYLKLIGGEE